EGILRHSCLFTKEFPKPFGKGEKWVTDDFLFGMLVFIGFQSASGFGFLQFGQPIDQYGVVVVFLMKYSGSPSRESEHHWSAQSPMRDKDGSLLFQLGSGNLKGHFRYRYSCQLGDGFVF